SVGAVLGIDNYYQTPPAPQTTVAPAPVYVAPGFQANMTNQRGYEQQPSLPQQRQQVLPTYPANQYSRGAISAINATRDAPTDRQARPNPLPTQPIQYPRTAYPQSLPDPQYNR
ncbi:MAG: hypothetical protein HOB73_04895, partial [Planctomycetaceae bacterium]|nr:hypothetical protein [Planctomycetaceae bacterium]